MILSHRRRAVFIDNMAVDTKMIHHHRTKGIRSDLTVSKSHDQHGTILIFWQHFFQTAGDLFRNLPVIPVIRNSQIRRLHRDIRSHGLFHQSRPLLRLNLYQRGPKFTSPVVPLFNLHSRNFHLVFLKFFAVFHRKVCADLKPSNHDNLLSLPLLTVLDRCPRE